ncbi:hypothetical protein ACFSKM_18375 [Ancylobacter dichloromethanicus]
MIDVVFNGKFLRAPATGVHRVAKELIVACARIASDDVEGGNGWRLTVVAPTSPQKNVPAARCRRCQIGRTERNIERYSMGASEPAGFGQR